MAVNLLSFSVDEVPIDELEAIRNDDLVFEMPFEFESICPPLSNYFIDNPNKHVRTQRGGHYPIDQLYDSKGRSNIDSNKSDGFTEVRRKELSENSTKSAIQIDPNLPKEFIDKKIREKDFNEYPRKMDWGPKDKPFEVWKEDRVTNLILDDAYNSTCVNRGRNEISFNEDIIIGNSHFLFQKLLRIHKTGLLFLFFKNKKS